MLGKLGFSRLGRTSGALGAFAVVGVLFMVVVPSAAWAGVPWWSLDSVSTPENLVPGSSAKLMVTATDFGAGSIGGPEQVVLRDALPAGVVAKSVIGHTSQSPVIAGFYPPVKCAVKSGSLVECTYAGSLPPFQPVEVLIEVEVTSEAKSGSVSEVSVSGGGAAYASIRRPFTVSTAPVKFGLSSYELGVFNEDGSLDTQAGSHPFELATTFDLNRTGASPFVPVLAKDVRVKLPPGLVGNPTALPECSDAQFTRNLEAHINECPEDTAVGAVVVTIDEEQVFHGFVSFTVPVFNLVPGVGEPARFGFDIYGSRVTLDTAVRAGGDYGVTVSSTNITQLAALLGVQVVIWGVPGDPVHDHSRGWQCVAGETWHILELEAAGPCKLQEQSFPPAFLSLPTSCTGSLQTSVEADSWAAPHEVLSFGPSAPTQALDSCNHLPFEPSIGLTPDGTAGSTPTGVTVDVHVPQEATLNARGLAESDPRSITVALPAGVAVNPAGGDGLAACTGDPGALSPGALGSPGDEVGYTGTRPLEDIPGETATFTSMLPSPLEQGVNFCPDASKVATVTIRTPILPHPIEGAAYLASQNQNPFGSLIAMYIVVQDPISGVLIKLAGQVSLDPNTGQLTATFQNSPQAPFEDAELHFFGGERAPLATPARCGPYTTTASFTPWSSEEPVASSSTFSVTSGPHGGPCPGASLPFNPTLNAGVSNINAGGFTPFTTTIGREDGQQNMQSVTVHTPPGLSGLLSGVKLCGEAHANEGTCGPESLIGETTVSAGVGGDPVTVVGGRVYITGPYHGAPFGLSVVNPVKAGPFDLEHDTSKPGEYMPACDCVVVRAKIEVDPITAALTVTTDTSGPYEIPHMIDGIPVQIKHVSVTINRPGFTFNPTSCNPMKITGSIGSDEGVSVPVSVPLQVTNCAVLAFKPTFKVSTSGHTSRRNGASLHVTLAYPKASFGSQANIASVKVDLPKQLPSRLTTLQKACTEQQFATNPAGCPPLSIVGRAKAITPLIPVPLEGPAYFVSHGGAKFPELIIVLQGYGVMVLLHGETFIGEKTGITSSTFHTIPDAPVGSFELTLPQGPDSALAANGNLCSTGQTILVKKRVKVRSKGRVRMVTRRVRETVAGFVMPTAFTAQNGMVIHQNTPIEVTGCAKAKKTNTSRRNHHRKK